MAHPYVDTDVIIRLPTGDDPAKQQAARELFEQVEQGALTLAAPDTVIADAVFVLASKKWYNKSRV
jgi:predicted nucleic acid-binding protein